MSSIQGLSELPWETAGARRIADGTLRKGRLVGWSIGSMLAMALLFVTAMPRTGFYATFTVLSGSMEPAIQRGSIVVAVPFDPATLQVNDVISFTSPAPPYPTLTHRIIFIQHTENGLLFQTKGDANLAEDPWKVRYTGSAGKVVLVVPLLGYFVTFLGNGATQIALGLLLGLTLVWVWLKTVFGSHESRTTPEPRSRVISSGKFRAGESVRSRSGRSVVLSWLVVGLVAWKWLGGWGA